MRRAVGFILLYFCLVAITQAATPISFPHRDRDFQEDFSQATQNQVGIIMQGTSSEIQANIYTLASVMADQVVRLCHSEKGCAPGTENYETISPERLKEITVRIYQHAQAQARVPSARVEAVAAFLFPAAVVSATGLASAAYNQSSTILVAAAAVLPVFTVLSSRAYSSYVTAKINDKPPVSLAESFFAPGERIGKALGQPLQKKLMLSFWNYLLEELRDRGQALDLNSKERADVRAYEQALAKKIGAPSLCETHLLKF